VCEGMGHEAELNSAQRCLTKSNPSPILMAGPLRVGDGNVIAAGTILWNDVTEENKLAIRKSYSGSITNFTANQYSSLSRLVSSNVLYLANRKAWNRKSSQF
jgi:hypothetical protein